MYTYKRALRACDWCHQRKVRCDATLAGCPCTRCKQDGKLECTLRSKRPAIPRGCAVAQNALAVRENNSEHSSLTASLTTSYDFPSIPGEGHTPFFSYHFLEFKSTSTLDHRKLALLLSEGHLSVPHELALDDFVKQYFLQIQPYAPILDEAEFWDIYQNVIQPFDGRKIPLLVFQALLFASCPYVSLKTVQNCGFIDRHTACNALYQRVKRLLEFCIEEDTFIKAQTAFLISFHASKDEPLAGSFWLTYSIKHAMPVQEQLGSQVPSARMTRVKSMKKRLWWSIIVRDRNVCLALRRHSLITPSSMRGVGGLLDEEDFATELQKSQVYGPATKRILFGIFCEQCKLALSLTEIVTFLFASSTFTAPLLSFERFQDLLAEVRRAKASLKLWERTTQLFSLKHENASDQVIPFINLVLICYQAARIDLAHYEAMLMEKHPLFTGHNYMTELHDIGHNLHDAMRQLMGLMEYFSQKGKAQKFPLSLLGYAALPLVLTAIDLKLAPSMYELNVCRQRLESLGGIFGSSGSVYVVADFISSNTNDILRLAYVTLRQVFLENNEIPLSSGRTTSSTHSLSSSGTAYLESQPRIRPNRPNSWLDAFLRHPRAYLLISATVDHFMSVGKLPCENQLPESICCLPSLGATIQFPWSTRLNKKVSAEHITIEHQPTEDEDVRFLSLFTSEQNKTTTQLVSTSPNVFNNTSFLISNDRPYIGDRKTTSITASGEHKDSVNLDYLCLYSSQAGPSLSPLSSLKAPSGSECSGIVQEEGFHSVEEDMPSNDTEDMWQLSPLISEYDSFLQEPLIFTG